MNEPLWVTKRDALLIHNQQIAEHGGSPGIRDAGLLESALARPINLFGYGGATHIVDLAASYAFGLAKNHPFIDGNKRTSFGVCLTFLDLNGFELLRDDRAAIATWEGLAAGSVTETALAQWIRARL